MNIEATLPETQANDTVDDAWNYKGRPALRSKSGGWISAAMILGVEGNERLTTLGIAVNLVTYLTGVMHLGNAASANIVTNFLGTSFMLCLFGGFVADTFLGRYMTIAIFATFQAMGAIILTISTTIPSLHPPPCTAAGTTCEQASGTQLGVLYLALYLMALGTGGVKSSVSGFGSDQFEETSKEERAQMSKFFSWFFFFINIGSLVAVTVLVYVQDNMGRRWGYAICACAIVAGLALFLAGTKRYRFKRLVGSPLTQIAAVVVCAWRKRRLELPAESAALFDVDEVADVGKKKKKQMLPRSKQFRALDKAAIKAPTDDPTNPNKWSLSTLTDVEEVKLVVKMLPIWATTIIFWTVYVQMNTLSVAQASTMDLSMGPHFDIPAASLTAFVALAILLTVPLYDRVFSPLVSRALPNGLSPLQRIGVGLVLSIIGMAVAALTELKRLRAAAAHPEDNVVPLSVFYLCPQFLIVGAGEAFTYIGQLDFFLRECPKGMKTMSTGLFLTTLSLGFFVSSILVTIVHALTGNVHPWIADDLNKGRLYNFYWLLVGLSVVNFLVFLVCSKRYVYKEKWLALEGFVVEDDDVPVCH
ncbi:hypothetical protein V2J09_011530 [Rumex salicifolius]